MLTDFVQLLTRAEVLDWRWIFFLNGKLFYCALTSSTSFLCFTHRLWDRSPKSDMSSHNIENRWKLAWFVVTADWLWGFKAEAIKWPAACLKGRSSSCLIKKKHKQTKKEVCLFTAVIYRLLLHCHILISILHAHACTYRPQQVSYRKAANYRMFN